MTEPLSDLELARRARRAKELLLELCTDLEGESAAMQLTVVENLAAFVTHRRDCDLEKFIAGLRRSREFFDAHCPDDRCPQRRRS